MKRLVLGEESKTIKLNEIDFGCNSKTKVAYITSSNVAVLTCLSSGEKKISWPDYALWGFKYLRDNSDPKFVRFTPKESIRMAIENGNKLLVFDSFSELVDHIK